MKVKYNNKNIEFTPLLQVLQVKKDLLFAVEPLSKKIHVDPTTVAAVMFNVLGFYVQLLEDNEQIEFVDNVETELRMMIETGFDRFDRGEKIK